MPSLRTRARHKEKGSIMSDTPITIVGNAVSDAELRFTSSGVAVANFRVASTPRKFNQQSNQWEDGEALFLTVNVWREQAENVAESIQKGMRVVVSGKLKSRSYETREGEKRTVFEVEADDIAPSLKYATAKVTKSDRKGGGGAPSGGFGQPQGFQQPAQGGWGSQDQDAPF